jgi:hypothetical protein
METLRAIAPTDALSVISESTRRYAEESRSKATRDAYAADRRAFYKWGGPIPFTAAEVADFLSWCADAGYAAATRQRRLSAISQAHQALGVENPTRSEGVRRTHKGIRRTLGTATVKKTAITSSDLRSYFASINGHLMTATAQHGLALKPASSGLIERRPQRSLRGRFASMATQPQPQEGSGRGRRRRVRYGTVSGSIGQGNTGWYCWHADLS